MGRVPVVQQPEPGKARRTAKVIADRVLQIIGATRGFPTSLFWVLMFPFEIVLGVWLLTSGGRDPEVAHGGAYSPG